MLRIEDTDKVRSTDQAIKAIISGLEWLNLNHDGKIVFQSNNSLRHKNIADELLKSGNAYRCYLSNEEQNQIRNDCMKRGLPFRSPWRNKKYNNDNENSYVIRIKMPRNEDVKFEDLIRGWASVNTNNLDDKVLFKSDGMPTYHLANVVDDYLMNISHVIRGEEWLPSAPLHVLLYRSLGWESVMPKFAHLPLILKPDGNGKLSKRDGDRLGFPVFPTNWTNEKTGESSSGYRERGYYPEAFNNMLAFLGWNPGTTQELFTMQELIEAFSLNRVGRAGAKFDFNKTKWFNQQYLRNRTSEDLAKQLSPLLKKEGFDVENDYVVKVCSLMKERAAFVKDILTDGRYFFEAPKSYDEKTVNKKWKHQTPEIIKELSLLLEKLPSFDSENIGACFKAFLESKNLGFGAVMPGFRLSVTGLGAGASMNEIAALLGKEEVLKRIDSALNSLKN